MMKILVVRACAIGDFVLNLPALEALRNARSGARLTLVGYPATLELAREFIEIDAIRSIESEPWSRLFYEPVAGLEFDSAVVWMKEPVVSENLRRSGIREVQRAGAFPQYGHAADHLLRTLGLARPQLPDRWSPGPGSEVIVNAGSGSAKKNWPYFDELMARIHTAVPMPRNLTLSELSGRLRRCRAYVGNDSGITHLAAYLGCPVTALFGLTDPRVWGPMGRRSRVIWKTKLEDISVDEVLRTLR